MVLFRTHINFFTVCVGKSTYVMLTRLIPALGSPLSNRCCTCAGIALQNGCQVANRETDFCGESIIHGIASEISRQRAGCLCALVNIKWFDFNKRDCFLYFRFGVFLCRLQPPPPRHPIFPVTRRITRKAG